MNDRPILYKPWMIQAILDDRKTMTRRKVKDPNKPCRFGVVGDRLWIKESFGIQNSTAIFKLDADPETLRRVEWFSPMFMPKRIARVWLEITGLRREHVQDITEQDAIAEGVEPLFTKADIYCDGKYRAELDCDPMPFKNYLWHGHHGRYGMGNKKSDDWEYQYSSYQSARDSFSSLYELINGKGSWEANDLVEVIEFKVIQP